MTAFFHKTHLELLTTAAHCCHDCCSMSSASSQSVPCPASDTPSIWFRPSWCPMLTLRCESSSQCWRNCLELLAVSLQPALPTLHHLRVYDFSNGNSLINHLQAECDLLLSSVYLVLHIGTLNATQDATYFRSWGADAQYCMKFCNGPLWSCCSISCHLKTCFGVLVI